ncbi:aromatic ring-hydroxylating oxygenase subunit alpha [Phenylobacterium montanum]|uniref:Aromatic ring-hydroxylating dioxygenase subunit alpha n=1 Tax=Phenylobacterium montanum TaxID=2823693 RepID=A0A975G249_9CAUL|nr:aromatic ring-hydroxylating dioxygenase subunit alpha [Caulobacter sp. S6]QUD89374.1 aromatic ring-hydroxylating dioxygenase subunit alpha [Caulobacter sp. S6]
MQQTLHIPGLEPSLPSTAYTDPGRFAREKEAIFTREWMAVCRTEEIQGPGAWRVVELAGESVLLVRGKDGALHAHYNVCRHRGARLCPAPGEQKPGRPELPPAVSPTGLIRCPYHAWTYSPAGELIGAPFLSDDADFPRERLSLYPVGCAEWGGFVFLHLTPAKAQPLEGQIGPAAARIANYPLADLRIGHRIAYEVEANWKILCENYNECYHCGPVHPELCAIVPAFRSQGGSGLEWERGIPHREGATTFTWTGTTKRAPFTGLNEDEKVRHKGELIYPNLFLSLAADHVAAFILWPLGPSRTRVECLFLFAEAEMARDDFDHTDASSFWDVVNQQDWAICERVQQGMGCRAHLQGFYAPMEDANLDMRRYIDERMGSR